MAFIDMKKHRDFYEINVFHSHGSKSHYKNIIDKDPHRLAQIFIDLIIMGFPVEKAIKIMRQKIKRKDWMGV